MSKGELKMGEVEKAIAYFEDAVRESDEIIDECSPMLREELTEQKQHFVVALAALKEAVLQSALDQLERKGAAK